MTKPIQPALQLLPKHLWSDGDTVHAIINMGGVLLLLLMNLEVGACFSPTNMNKMMMVMVMATTTMISCDIAVPRKA